MRVMSTFRNYHFLTVLLFDICLDFVFDIFIFRHFYTSTFLLSTKVGRINGNGSAMNQFYGPSGLFVDKKKNVYVVDSPNSRVQKWYFNGTIKTVAGGNGYGSALNQLRNPSQIVVDSEDNVYVDDNTVTNDGRIMKWSPGATTGTVHIAGGPSIQIDYPISDASGNIYITDITNRQVLRYNINNNACSKSSC